MCVPLGWGERLSTPKSNGFIFMNHGFFGGRGIARPPSSSHARCVHQQCRCVLRSRKDWHLSLPPHIVEEFSGGGGIGPPPHISGEYFGGGGTGPPPHNVGEYFGGEGKAFSSQRGCVHLHGPAAHSASAGGRVIIVGRFAHFL